MQEIQENNLHYSGKKWKSRYFFCIGPKKAHEWKR
jgi:hypothetical protein